MFRRVSLKIILSIFFTLLAIVVIVEIIDFKKGERTFRGDLIKVDPDEITEIQILPKVLRGNKISLLKEGEKWVVEFNSKKYNANESLPGSLISELNGIKPESVASTKKEQWIHYELTDSLATRVKLLNNSKVLCDLLIGKFNFSQSRKMTSYVRLARDKEIYAVDGFLSMAFNRDVNTFRDQTIIKKGNADWTKLTFNNPTDGSFILNKINEKWFVNDSPADSALIAGYFSGISNLTNSEFIDQKPSGGPTFSLLIEGNNLTAPVHVEGYYLDEGNMIIESSQNPGSYFKNKELTDKIFISKNKLLKL